MGAVCPSYISAGTHFLKCLLYFFELSLFSACLPLLLCLISILQFPCASVQENTRACFIFFIAIINGTCFFSLLRSSLFWLGSAIKLNTMIICMKILRIAFGFADIENKQKSDNCDDDDAKQGIMYTLFGGICNAVAYCSDGTRFTSRLLHPHYR